MSILINAFKIIFLLGFLILIHEGGHFLAAKFFKVKVEKFSIGFGPRIFSKQGKETTYSISLIPFGGYVQMTGEMERSDEKGAFNNAKILHRIAIVASGPIINILFGIIVYFILILTSGVYASTIIEEIIPEALPNISNLQVGDKIIQINDEKIRIKSDIDKALAENKGEEISIIASRDGKEISAKVTPTEYTDGVYILGIKLERLEANFNDRIYIAFWKTVDFTGSIGSSMVMLFTGKVSVNQMAGPIGISSIVAESKGIYNFIYLLCLISMSLGITNLLPIPALDGGRLLLLIIEAIRGKALDEDLELKIQSIGFTLLILLSLYVSYNDILRLF